MKKRTHPIYKDYPEQPFISEKRDLEKWANDPKEFPYGVVERRQMVRTEEGLLPGDVVLLWRIHFGNFTTETWIPEYFEYRYGVDSEASAQLLLEKELVTLGNARDALSELNMHRLKKILKKYDLPVSGKRQEILDRVHSLSDAQLEEAVQIRRYQATELGEEVLSRHDDIIVRHGPKQL